jgi:hypothetical protein
MKILFSLVLLFTFTCAREKLHPKDGPEPLSEETRHARLLNDANAMCTGKDNCYVIYNDPDDDQLIHHIRWSDFVHELYSADSMDSPSVSWLYVLKGVAT